MEPDGFLKAAPKFFTAADVAFEGTVTTLADSSVGPVVIIKVAHTFKGNPGAIVRVRQGLDDFGEALFTVGQTHLIAAGDTTVDPRISGQADSPDLLAAYEQAFGQWR